MLRAATLADFEPICDIEVRCFKERRFRRDHVDWILRNERCLTVVEQDRGNLVAALMLLFEGRTCRVLSIAVVPEHRRHGLGTSLMNAAEEIASERGCETIRLEVSTSNHGAIEFYRRLGYRTDGVLYGYYSWGEDAYSMSHGIAVRTSPPTRKPAWDRH